MVFDGYETRLIQYKFVLYEIMWHVFRALNYPYFYPEYRFLMDNTIELVYIWLNIIRICMFLSLKKALNEYLNKMIELIHWYTVGSLWNDTDMICVEVHLFTSIKVFGGQL